MERRVDRGARVAAELHHKLAAELRDQRVAAGFSQRRLAASVGTTHSTLSRIEAHRAPATTLRTYAELFAVLGHRLSVKVYPDGSPLRDRPQLRLLDRFRGRLHQSLGTRREVLVGSHGDLRAWDMAIDTREGSCMVDAESVLSDLQALERRIGAKARDCGADIVILLVADTHRNRKILREHGDALRTRFPGDPRSALRALAQGRLPDTSTIIVL